MNRDVTLSLHDALPISAARALPRQPGAPHDIGHGGVGRHPVRGGGRDPAGLGVLDRKSTRLNSSHSQSSYADFCLKKKNDRALLASTEIHRIELQARTR